MPNINIVVLSFPWQADRKEGMQAFVEKRPAKFTNE